MIGTNTNKKIPKPRKNQTGGIMLLLYPGNFLSTQFFIGFAHPISIIAIGNCESERTELSKQWNLHKISIPLWDRSIL